MLPPPTHRQQQQQKVERKLKETRGDHSSPGYLPLCLPNWHLQKKPFELRIIMPVSFLTKPSSLESGFICELGPPCQKVGAEGLKQENVTFMSFWKVWDQAASTVAWGRASSLSGLEMDMFIRHAHMAEAVEEQMMFFSVCLLFLWRYQFHQRMAQPLRPYLTLVIPLKVFMKIASHQRLGLCGCVNEKCPS